MRPQAVKDFDIRKVVWCQGAYLFGVTVVTYDELFDRVAELIRLLERPSA